MSTKTDKIVDTDPAIFVEGKPLNEVVNGKTFNVCYLREYMDPEHEGDFFYAYETVYRNVPNKFKKYFTESMKLKIVKFLDWNYKETATNFAKTTKVQLISEKKYYQTYEDVFGETATGDKNLFNDYGQAYARQSLRKDFNPKLTKSKVRYTKYAWQKAEDLAIRYGNSGKVQ